MYYFIANLNKKYGYFAKIHEKTTKTTKNKTLKHIIMFYTAEWSTKLPEVTNNVSFQYNLPLTIVFLISGK